MLGFEWVCWPLGKRTAYCILLRCVYVISIHPIGPLLRNLCCVWVIDNSTWQCSRCEMRHICFLYLECHCVLERASWQESSIYAVVVLPISCIIKSCVFVSHTAECIIQCGVYVLPFLATQCSVCMHLVGRNILPCSLQILWWLRD